MRNDSGALASYAKTETHSMPEGRVCNADFLCFHFGDDATQGLRTGRKTQAELHPKDGFEAEQ